MYFFYVDESGDRNPAVKRDEPFVMIALGLHEYQWRRFETAINGRKLALIQNIHDRTGIQLDLADAEVHSVDVRIPKKRAVHPFLKHLTEAELTGLVDLFLGQLESKHFTVMAVVVDKSCLLDYMDEDKVTKKVYELLLERGETFIRNEHGNQQAIYVLDNTSKQMNRSVAMKHAYFQRNQTTAGIRLKHVVEMPFFVESYLSNGVQLADLCAYNVHRAFRSVNEHYPHFQRLLPYFYKSALTPSEKIDGLKVFPDNHRWTELVGRIEKERARLLSSASGSSK
jgi:predicted SprT family Zn-dependent metalloprotease